MGRSRWIVGGLLAVSCVRATPDVGRALPGETAEPLPVDEDGDGLTADEDCDDLDERIGGDEIPYDALDNDCDPTTPDDDLDGDGLPWAEDCDDAVPTVTSAPTVWSGDLTTADVAGFCAADCYRVIDGDVRIEDSAFVDLADLWCVSEVRGDLILGSTEVRDYTDMEHGNPQLASLHGLENLTRITGRLSLEHAPALTTLAALSRLESVGDVYVTTTPALRTLGGLEQLRSVEHDLVLWGSDVVDLSGLSGLESVGGRLALGDDSEVTTLALSSLEEVGGKLQLQSLPRLESLGLPRLERLGGLELTDVPALTTLDGLQRITELGFPNQALTSLEGLGSLRTIGEGLVVSGNPALADVTALHGLTRVGQEVWVTSNGSLGDDAAWALVEEIDVIGGPVTIEGNGH